MITAVLLGAGNRGMFAYGPYALNHPNEIQFIGVAEPDPKKRKMFASAHNISRDLQFETWEELLNKPKLADTLFICTQDDEHFEPALKALELGYDILLEKPMSLTPQETLKIAEKAESTGRIVTVAHVLRYATFFKELKKVIENKEDIGDIMTIEWTENVGYYHHAHSYVRGNWRKGAEYSSMLLQKSCHDIDLIQWLVEEDCKQVSSFGRLTYFTEQYAPKEATKRCIDCPLNNDCVYSALKLYYNDKEEWPVNVVEPEPDAEKRLKAITEGPYGICVYKSDNDVVDHQVVNLEFQNGVTVTFTMSAFTKDIGRTFTIGTTKAEISGSTIDNEITIKYYTGKTVTIHPERVEGGHGGADTMIMKDFVRQVKGIKESKTTARNSAMSHLIVFAAEHARKTSTVVNVNQYINKFQDHK